MIGAGRGWARLVAAMLAFIYLVPLAWIVITALKSDDQIRGAPNSLAFTPTLSVFGEVLDDASTSIVTSTQIAGATTLLVLAIGLPAAYAVARIPSSGWRHVVTATMGVLMVLQMVPQPMAVIPLFSLLARWGLVGSVTGVVLADVALLLPFAVLLLRPFVMAIPPVLYEAFEIDGATAWQRFRHLVFPLVSNGLATVGSIVFILAWGEFIYATTFLTEQSKLPVSGLLAQQTNLYSVSWNRMMALAVLTSLPLVAVFIVAQKRLVSGLSAGAVK